jgi:dipeptidyl aminopeptidase/acylaminoacyl peptidase
VFAWTQERFDDPRDYFVAEGGFQAPRQVTTVNPFQSEYAWGQTEAFRYANSTGVALMASLHYPANYEAGKRYPMIVEIYERLRFNHHRYQAPSERSVYNSAVWTARGYFVLHPDIAFRPRDPGVSALDSVSAAVKAALATGKIDPQRVGVIGHSWGGYETTFFMTHSDLFAAGVAGAPLTNLSSSYGEIYWNNGIPETGHVETGQERMEAPLYEDPQAYIRNSATFAANRLRPLLLAHGDKDGACDWHQSIELYNIARRAGRPVVLLVYPGENHSLRVKANQMDYHRRILAWFGHYLKGEGAPKWIESGVTFLEQERARKKPEGAPPSN